MARVDFELMGSVLLAFNFNKFLLIQFLMFSRQVVSVEGQMSAVGFGGDVNLCVISVPMGMDPMVSEDGAQR